MTEKLPVSFVTISLLRHVVLSRLVATARRKLRKESGVSGEQSRHSI
jgi:hypothetical protein